MTPLHIACLTENQEIISLLLEQGEYINKNATNIRGKRPTDLTKNKEILKMFSNENVHDNSISQSIEDNVYQDDEDVDNANHDDEDVDNTNHDDEDVDNANHDDEDVDNANHDDEDVDNTNHDEND